MNNIEIENDAFTCKREGDFAILTLNKRAQKILSTIGFKDDLISHLSLIKSSPDIKGIALINSDQYPGAEEYKRLLYDIIPNMPDETRKGLASRFNTAISQIIDIILNFPIPIVAGMNGNIGPESLGFYMAFDFRIASKTTNFFINPNIQFGIPPTSLLSFFLVKNLGPARAIELLLSHPKLSVVKAYQLGLVSEIVDEGNVELKCLETLNGLSSFSGYAVSETRRILQPDKAEIKKHIETIFESSYRGLYKKGI